MVLLYFFINCCWDLPLFKDSLHYVLCSGQPFLNKDGSPMVYQPLTTLQQRQQSLAQQTHLSTQAVNQQQIVAQSSQHSNLQPLSQYSQPIADSQLCAPHMVPFIPQQGQQSLPMVVQNAAVSKFQLVDTPCPKGLKLSYQS